VVMHRRLVCSHPSPRFSSTYFYYEG
jgi:hypothetical protein